MRPYNRETGVVIWKPDRAELAAQLSKRVQGPARLLTTRGSRGYRSEFGERP